MPNNCFFNLPGFEAIDDPDAQPWLDRAHSLATAYSLETHGTVRPTDLLVIHLAASILWRLRPGAPRWTDWTHDLLDEHLGRVGIWKVLRFEAKATCSAFLSFLAGRSGNDPFGHDPQPPPAQALRCIRPHRAQVAAP